MPVLPIKKEALSFLKDKSSAEEKRKEWLMNLYINTIPELKKAVDCKAKYLSQSFDALSISVLFFLYLFYLLILKENLA
ncbi:MAG: hypothetical protein D3925_02650 [Candidatus Electrothrix sp. AR5]|nr:hypothetical protein [Candidatus Electrothrix sp. AR5]